MNRGGNNLWSFVLNRISFSLSAFSAALREKMVFIFPSFSISMTDGNAKIRGTDWPRKFVLSGLVISSPAL
jgi:hypothetical protein